MNYAKQLWPYLGVLAGYLLVMCSNPVRASLRDGVRALRRYPSLWLTLGLFGFGYAVFELGVRFYLSCTLPPADAPLFIWARTPFRPEWTWVVGLRDSLWYLPALAPREIVHEAVLPMLDGTAGLFNNLVSTFPLAALAAIGLLFNAQRRQLVLLRALRRLFGGWGIAAHGGILLCALAALIKPVLLVFLRFAQDPAWFQWSQVIGWLAFLFEYLFGVYIQVYLILLAYCWVRGISFQRHDLVDFAIRRSSFVLRWAVVVMLLSTVFIDLPLILKNFFPLADWIGHDNAAADRWLNVTRTALDAILIFFATVQITLTFHSESLRVAWRDHGRFVWRNAWPLAWFLAVAAMHFYLIHVLDLVCRAGFGEGTALWVSWRLIFPWLSGIVGAWLLASWVCVFKRCDTGRAASENWIRF